MIATLVTEKLTSLKKLSISMPQLRFMEASGRESSKLIKVYKKAPQRLPRH
jgi:hypothetical protein